MSDVRNLEGKRQATITPDEVEITPLMIEAGAWAISGYWSTNSLGFSPEELAKLIYRAMEHARRQTPRTFNARVSQNSVWDVAEPVAAVAHSVYYVVEPTY